MKFDEHQCVIREKYLPDWHPGNIGDSCFLTGQYAVLSQDKEQSFMQFQASPIGYLRHPELPNWPGMEWGGPDRFSGDQFVPMVLGTLIQGRPLSNLRLKGNEWRVPGTKAILTPAAWCLIRGHYRTLNVLNYIQGLILKFPYRWSDSKKQFEKTKGSSVDYLNMILIWHFLRATGRWASLGATKEKCKQMVFMYYKNGPDWEPNVDWFINYYLKTLA